MHDLRSLNTVLTVISLIFIRKAKTSILRCLNTVLTVISLIELMSMRPPDVCCLNTVLTVISLIVYGSVTVKIELSQYRSHGYLFNHFNFQQHQSSFQLFLLLQSSHDYLFNKHFSHFSQVYSFFITNEKKTTLFILKNTSKSINQSVFP